MTLCSAPHHWSTAKSLAIHRPREQKEPPSTLLVPATISLSNLRRFVFVVMPIDYSKWDHLEFSDSEEEEEYSSSSTTPRVTRLEEPSRITFGGGGSNNSNPTVEERLPTPATAVTHPDGSVDQQASLQVSSPPVEPSVSNASSTDTTPHNDTLNGWTRRGGSLETTDHRALFWSQDRYVVQLRLELKGTETIDRITVDGILPYSNRHCATGTIKTRLCMFGKQLPSTSHDVSIPLLEGSLPHPVHWSQDDESEDLKSLDWLIERYPTADNRRFAVLTLHKAVPMHGLFVWWKRPLLQFEEIILDDEECGRSGASKDFLQSWDEAHRLFRENKSRGPHILPST